LATQDVGWENGVDVVATETLGANCFAAAMEAKELVSLPGITSIAKSLGADRVSETLFRLAREGPTKVMLLIIYAY
jgi:L-serine/L-threonine ammonia-lyase